MFLKSDVSFEKGRQRESDGICKEFGRFPKARPSRKAVNGRKKGLRNLVFFSVGQKTRQNSILTILGSTLRFTFGSVFMKKRVFFQVCSFFDFVMFFERGGRRGEAPILLRIPQEIGCSSITPSSPEGVRRILRASPPAAGPYVVTND